MYLTPQDGLKLEVTIKRGVRELGPQGSLLSCMELGQEANFSQSLPSFKEAQGSRWPEDAGSLRGPDHLAQDQK